MWKHLEEEVKWDGSPLQDFREKESSAIPVKMESEKSDPATNLPIPVRIAIR